MIFLLHFQWTLGYLKCKIRLYYLMRFLRSIVYYTRYLCNKTKSHVNLYTNDILSWPLPYVEWLWVWSIALLYPNLYTLSHMKCNTNIWLAITWQRNNVRNHIKIVFTNSHYLNYQSVDWLEYFLTILVVTTLLNDF